MRKLSIVQQEIEKLKEKYWKCINMHNPTPRVFKARQELDDQIRILEREEAEIQTAQA